MPDNDVERLRIAAQELSALAALIERLPLDDVLLEQSVAMQSAAAIRVVLSALPQVGNQPHETGSCILCAGECRGHSLGHEDEWVPEPGSQAAGQVGEKPVGVEDDIARGARWLEDEFVAQEVGGGVNDLHIDEDQFTHVIRPMLAALATLSLPPRDAMREALESAPVGKSMGDMTDRERLLRMAEHLEADGGKCWGQDKGTRYFNGASWGSYLREAAAALNPEGPEEKVR